MANTYVFIVDDDRSIVRLCQRLLERAAYEVLASTDPLEAIHILEQRKVDLLLADIRMPVMDGFELIERSRALQPDLAVLVMTGFGTVDTAVQALYKGVDGLILKPFENTADLVQAVQRVLVDSRQKQDAARVQALRPLFDISERLLSETEQEPLQQMIRDVILNTFRSQFVCVYHIPAGSKETRLVIQKNTPDPVGAPGWAHVIRFVFSSSVGSVINVTGPGDANLQGALRSLGWSSFLFTPITRNEDRFVFITGREASANAFSDSDLELFTILARQAVVALENARLYTDLKEYIKKVEESQRAMIQVEKMAAVGRLMASLAHEINNPLQSVRNCVHLAMRADIGDPQRAQYLSMTEAEVERLVNTVRHMLEFYRPGPVEREFADLNGIVERVAQLIKPQMDSSTITLHLNLPVVSPQVYCVRDQIQQVLFNLFLNSMDALENTADKHIWLDGNLSGRYIRLTIEDSGSGIDPEIRDKLFEPFISTKKAGTGLGLSISFTIIEAHGGQLTLINGKHGKGACFEIRLPLGREE
ncbi:MAG: response regulator [Anaerolineae bacterium]|nr:response regulator [Anaerolineae bacterium]